MSEPTFIGLDVHARSVAAGVLDGASGEVRSCAAPVRTAELVEWLRRQGEAIAVAPHRLILPASTRRSGNVLLTKGAPYQRS